MKYVIIDIETTGLDIESSAIIEVAAILINDSTIQAEYHSLIKYKWALPFEIKRLTGITDDMLQDAPSIQHVVSELQTFIKKYPVIAHNGFNFDFPLLERAGIKFEEKYDSMEYAFFVLPVNYTGHSVRALARFFKLEEEKHRALDDCKLQHEILKNLKDCFIKRRKDQREALKYVASSIKWWWVNFLPGQARPCVSIVDLIDEYKSYKKRVPEQDRLSLQTTNIDLREVASCFDRIGGESTEVYSEDRPEQRNMAVSIAEALNSHKHAVIEAGTGTGKSKAYLAPSALFARRNNIPVVIATYTKALQIQLFNKEIPHIKDIISHELRVSLLMGKANYVCLQKFDDAFRGVGQKFFDRSLYEFREGGVRFTSQLSYLLLASWVCETQRGDWEEIPYWLKERRMPKKVANEILNTDELCDKEACELYDAKKCFLAKARMAARDSDLIIINHAIALGGIIAEEIDHPPDNPEAPETQKRYSHTVFPGEAQYIVFDEANHLEDAATTAWENVISGTFMKLFVERLYGKRGIKKYLDSHAKHGATDLFLSSHALFVSTEQKMRILTDSLFSKALPQVAPIDYGSPYKKVERIEVLRNAGQWDTIDKLLTDIFDSLVSVKHSLEDIRDHATDERLKKKVTIRACTVQTVLRKIGVILGTDKEYVRYVENSGNELSLKAALISVAQRLREYVYDNYTTIMTSAAIQVGGDFSFFASRCGTSLIAREKVTYQLFSSSFDYEKQVQFFVPSGVAYNSNDRNNHLSQCIELLKQMVVASNGGALILCSSHEQVDTLYEELKNTLDKANIWLLRQYAGGSVTSIVESFKTDTNSVLIGTKTLWQGIDVPGEALRSLFIVKIPYSNFSDPIIRARREAIDDVGMDSYGLYYEPLAALELKQGFGRLIRKRTDKGIAVLLDENLMNKPRILSSLPPGVHPMRTEPNNIIRELNKLTLSNS